MAGPGEQRAEVFYRDIAIRPITAIPPEFAAKERPALAQSEQREPARRRSGLFWLALDLVRR